MRAVNLIPADQRAGAGGPMGRSEGAVYVLLGFVVLLALMLLLYGKARHQATTLKAQVTALNAKAQREQEAATQLGSYTNFLALRDQREQAVSALVDSRFDWAHIFHELGRVLPPGQASVTSLSGTVGGAGASGVSGGSGSSSPSSSSSSSSAGGSGGSPGGGSSTASAPSGGSSGSGGAGSTASSVSSATPPGSVPSFTLSGCATSQAVVALTLNRLRLIDGVSEVTLQNSTKSGSTAGASPSGGCGRGPSFTIGLTFQPLPSANEARAAAVARSVSSGGLR